MAQEKARSSIRTRDDYDFSLSYETRDLRTGWTEIRIKNITGEQVDCYSLTQEAKIYRLTPDASGKTEVDRDLNRIEEMVAKVAPRLTLAACLSFARVICGNSDFVGEKLIDTILWLPLDFWDCYSEKLDKCCWEDQRGMAYRDLFLIMATAHEGKRDALTINKAKKELEAVEQKIHSAENKIREAFGQNEGDITLGRIISLIAEKEAVENPNRTLNPAIADTTLLEVISLLREKLTRDIENIDNTGWSWNNYFWSMPLVSGIHQKISPFPDRRSQKKVWETGVIAAGRILQKHFIDYTGDAQDELSAEVMLSVFPSERPLELTRGKMLEVYTGKLKKRRREQKEY